MKSHNFFIKTVLEISKESNCVSYKVGALLVKDSRIISMGYNGTPSGFINCSSKFKNYSADQREDHHKWSNSNEIHAEMNAILWAAKNGVSTSGCTLYSTLFPCENCLKNIYQAGITEIYYIDEYDKQSSDSEFLKWVKSKIKIEKLQLK